MISAEAQVRAIIQLQADEEQVAFLQSTFNTFIHLPVQVIHPPNRQLQHIFSLHMQRLNCSLASCLEKTDLQSGSSTVTGLRGDRITMLLATQPTKMLPTKNVVSRIVYSPTDSLLP